MNPRIIVTADDFGACDFIDRGIIEAVKAGAVTSVAAMINFEPRDASHPFGAYKGSIAAIKELLEVKDKAGHDVRIGLHLNFHAGSPVFPKKNEISTLWKKKTIGGQTLPYFKQIEKFNPTKINDDEFIKELRAQLSKFKQGLGFMPDSLSAHFPIIFMVPRYFNWITEMAEPFKIPIRNPFALWQTKNKEKTKKKRQALRAVKQHFKKSSKTKRIGLKRALGTVDILDDTLLNGWKRKNIKSLVENKIYFPDYTQSHLYGNGKRTNAIENILSNIPAFHPHCYNGALRKDSDTPIVMEIITHLGTGAFNTKEVPIGIDSKYFSGRKAELESLLESPLKDMELFNFKTALEAI